MYEDPNIKWPEKGDTSVDDLAGHYYGRIIRLIFVVGGIVMLVTLPFFSNLIPLPLPVSLVAIILLAIFGGLINPMLPFVLVLNVIVSVFALALFEYSASYAYVHLPPDSARHIAFFWVNQILSLLFFFATYLSVKTVRARFLRNKVK